MSHDVLHQMRCAMGALEPLSAAQSAALSDFQAKATDLTSQLIILREAVRKKEDDEFRLFSINTSGASLSSSKNLVTFFPTDHPQTDNVNVLLQMVENQRRFFIETLTSNRAAAQEGLGLFVQAVQHIESELPKIKKYLGSSFASRALDSTLVAAKEAAVNAAKAKADEIVQSIKKDASTGAAAGVAVLMVAGTLFLVFRRKNAAVDQRGRA